MAETTPNARSYSLDRSRQGYRLRVRTPAPALEEALGIEELPDLTIDKTDGEEEKEAA
jgi:hypothetical protein